MTVIEVCENGCLLENDSANKSCPKCNAAIIFSKELEDSDDKNYYAQIKAQTLNEAKTIALEKLENNPNAVASQIKIQQQLIESLADIFRNELKKLGSGIDSLSNLLNSLKSADYEKNKEKLSIDDILKRNSEINNKNV